MPKVPIYERRVAPAPMAAQRATSRISGDEAGGNIGRAVQGLGQEIQQAAGVVGQFAVQRAREQTAEENKAIGYEADQALIDAKNKAREAQASFTALKSAAATPQAYEEHRRALKNIFDQAGQKLSAKAAERYKQESYGLSDAMLVDAGSHYKQQLTIAADETRNAKLAGYSQTVVSQPDSQEGAAAFQAAMDTIAEDTTLTKERLKQKQDNFASKTALGAVDTLLKRGDLAQATKVRDGLQARLLPEDREAIDLALKQAGQAEEDSRYAGAVVKGVMSTPTPNEVPLAELEMQRATAIKQIEEDKTLDKETRSRRISLVERQFAGMQRERSAVMSIHENTRTKVVMDAFNAYAQQGGDGALKAVDDAIESSEPWLRPALRERVARLMAGISGSGKDTPAQLPVAERDRFKTAVWEMIKLRQFETLATLENHIAVLPREDQDELKELWKTGGDVNGLNPDKVAESVARIRGLGDEKEWRDQKDKLSKYYPLVRALWPIDKKATAANIDEIVKQLEWSAKFRDQAKMTGGFTEGTVGDALVAGTTSVELNMDPALAANAKEQLRARGVDPDPVARKQTGFSMWSGRPTFDTVSQEPFPLQRESDYYLGELYKRFGFTEADYIDPQKGIVPFEEARQRRLSRMGGKIKAAQQGAK